MCVRECRYCTLVHLRTHSHTHSLCFRFVTVEPVTRWGVGIVKQFTDESGNIIGLFRGYVSEVDVDESDVSVLYTIIYEDGDTEDMYEKECLEWIRQKIREWGDYRMGDWWGWVD